MTKEVHTYRTVSMQPSRGVSRGGSVRSELLACQVINQQAQIQVPRVITLISGLVGGLNRQGKTMSANAVRALALSTHTC